MNPYLFYAAKNGLGEDLERLSKKYGSFTTLYSLMRVSEHYGVGGKQVIPKTNSLCEKITMSGRYN